MNTLATILYRLIIFSMLLYLCFKVEYKDFVPAKELPKIESKIDSVEINKLNKKIKQLKYQIKQDNQHIEILQKNYEKAVKMLEE